MSFCNTARKEAARVLIGLTYPEGEYTLVRAQSGGEHILAHVSFFHESKWVMARSSF